MQKISYSKFILKAEYLDFLKGLDFDVVYFALEELYTLEPYKKLAILCR